MWSMHVPSQLQARRPRSYKQRPLGRLGAGMMLGTQCTVAVCTLPPTLATRLGESFRASTALRIKRDRTQESKSY